jgi:tripartite-type tricarboxylate transporter receptor subunit TctC
MLEPVVHHSGGWTMLMNRVITRALATARVLLCGGLALFELAGGRAAASDTYPSRAIRIIVPFPAGGGADATARLVAEGLSRRLGQPIYIENKAGSGGLIGGEAVVRAPADGYTILVATDALTSVPHVLRASFDPLRDLVPVAQLTRQPVVLAVHPSLGIGTIDELVALAKRQPGMGYATSGLAAPQSIAPVWFAHIAGIRLAPVPYRGGGPAVNDLIAGHVKIGSIGVAPLIAHYKSGAVRLLAQSGETRAPGLPEVPTFQEAGIKGLVLDQWFGVFAPVATPAAIIARLNHEIGKVLAEPAIRAKLQQTAQEPVGGSTEEFARLVRRDHERYRQLVTELDIKAH